MNKEGKNIVKAVEKAGKKFLAGSEKRAKKRLKEAKKAGLDFFEERERLFGVGK